MQLSSLEKTLYAELIIQITARMADFRLSQIHVNNERTRENRFDFKNLVIYHSAMHDFEVACSVLQQTNVVYPVKNDGTPAAKGDAWAGAFLIRFSLPELHDHLRQDLPDSAPPLSQVIESFLSLTTQYGGGPPSLSTRREPFDVPTSYAWPCHLLKQCGYLENSGRQVRWTNKIAPMMQENYAWDEHGRSLEEQQETELANDTQKMWDTLPPQIHKDYFSGYAWEKVDIIGLSIVISELWYEGKWQETGLHEGQQYKWLRGDSLAQARALVEKFRESRGCQ